MCKFFFAGVIVLGCLFWQGTAFCQSSASTLQVKAYQRMIMQGAAPTVELEVGDVEKPGKALSHQSLFYIYLLASKATDIKLNQVWIKQEAYEATLNRVTKKPVVLKNGKQTDTLIANIPETVWQINIKEKASNSGKPKKAIAGSVANNELVLKLMDAKCIVYIRTVKNIKTLEPLPGM